MEAPGVALTLISFDYSLLFSNATPVFPRSPSKTAPRPPWDPKAPVIPPSELVKTALAKRSLLDTDGQKQALGRGGLPDYPELFALYNGFTSLDALAQRADAKGVSSVEARQLERRFQAGMKEIGGFVDGLDLQTLKLVRGEVAERARTATGVRRDTPEYRTGVVHRGDRDAPVAAWAGEVKFQLSVSRPPLVITGTDSLGRPTTTSVPSSSPPVVVDFDLAELGADGTRTLGAVVNYLNGKLADAGVQTRFEREKITQPPRTVKVGEKTITLPAGPDEWTLKLKGALSEVASFTAPASADAVYVAQVAGEAVKDKPESQARELLKFQTDVATATPPPAAINPGGEGNWVEGRVFSRTLDSDVAAVRASATGADGSLYTLAELTGDVAGQGIKGERDVALLKYDSAGQLLWSRTLGAADLAGGTAIAVGADGRIAIGGSVTGGLRDAGSLGPVDGSTINPLSISSLNAAEPDSFVTVFDAEGSEQWTRRGGAIGADEVRSLAFGPDGALYAAGKTVGGMPGAGAASGGVDGWIRGWDADGRQTFTQQFGTTGADEASALSVEGTTLVTAGVENGRAVLRRFDLSTPGVALQTAMRDLGDLQGGAIKGVALESGRVTLAGTTRSDALAAAATNGFSGGRDAFVAALDGSLTADAADRVTFWGGAGEDEVSAVAIRGGQAWITGATTGAVAGTTKVGDKDGFVARIDAATGAVGWTKRWTAKDGEAAPTSIAVGAGGASVLDRLGLPTGPIDYSGAQDITASTSARAGDRFYLRVNGGRQMAVTLEADDTLKTLTTRINRVLGFNARAEVTRSTGLQTADGQVLPGVFERLEIKPRNVRGTVELIPGEDGRDLLGALGLMEGTLRPVVRDKAGKTVPPEGGETYGLKLARDLTLESKTEIKRSIDEIATAMNSIRTAYRALADALKPPRAPGATGAAPAWMMKQSANYQAALSRLSGGG